MLQKNGDLFSYLRGQDFVSVINRRDAFAVVVEEGHVHLHDWIEVGVAEEVFVYVIMVSDTMDLFDAARAAFCFVYDLIGWYFHCETKQNKWVDRTLVWVCPGKSKITSFIHDLVQGADDRLLFVGSLRWLSSFVTCSLNPTGPCAGRRLPPGHYLRPVQTGNHLATKILVENQVFCSISTFEVLRPNVLEAYISKMRVGPRIFFNRS